jgi:hypothetical protein
MTEMSALRWRVLGWLLAIGLTLAVFVFYTDPHFMMTLADQLWACF